MGDLEKTTLAPSAPAAENAPELRLTESLAVSGLRRVPEPQSIEISAITSKEAHGILHLVRLGEVDVLPLASTHLSHGVLSDVLSYALLPDARGECVKRVMIADTLPSDSIRELVERLHRAGVEVHFRDHHHNDYATAEKNYLFNEERISKCLAANCVVTTREKAPSIVDIIEQGELAEGGRSLYICAPADVDALSGAMVAANLHPDRLRKSGMASISRALGVMDSKIGHYSGSKPPLIDWFNRLRGEIHDDPKKLQTAVVSMAIAIRDQNDKFANDRGSAELERDARIRDKALLDLLKPPFTVYGERSIRLDLSKAGKAYAEFSGRSDAQALAAMHLMQPDGFELNSLMGPCGRKGQIGSHRNFQHGMAVMVKLDGRHGPEYGIMVLGKYGEINFRRAETELRLNLRTNIGFKAFVSEADFPKVFNWLKTQMDRIDNDEATIAKRPDPPARSWSIVQPETRNHRLRRIG